MPSNLNARRPLFDWLPSMAKDQSRAKICSRNGEMVKQDLKKTDLDSLDHFESEKKGKERSENKVGIKNKNAVLIPFANELLDLEEIQKVIGAELSEPYSIYTYRYFISNWPDLCFVARDTNTNELIGAIVCKDETDTSTSKQIYRRGYIAMLAVTPQWRGQGIGTMLVKAVIEVLRRRGCNETEVNNGASLALYDRLGFMKDDRMHRYYLNGVDAYRLKLFLGDYVEMPDEKLPELPSDEEILEEEMQSSLTHSAQNHKS